MVGRRRQRCTCLEKHQQKTTRSVFQLISRPQKAMSFSTSPASTETNLHEIVSAPSVCDAGPNAQTLSSQSYLFFFQSLEIILRFLFQREASIYNFYSRMAKKSQTTLPATAVFTYKIMPPSPSISNFCRGGQNYGRDKQNERPDTKRLVSCLSFRLHPQQYCAPV